MKAFLTYLGTQPPRSHDLPRLLRLCAVRDPSLASHVALVHSLNPYGVLVRYPGMAAPTLAEGKDALLHVRELRRALRRRLGL
ncbi:MAG: HEPN domain-containing protein [Planctomycetes bacterium]|nr:HEPN domain-containing protein [Planctomycetota bacterium]